MRRWFRDINIPTFVAVLVFTTIDRRFGISQRIMGTLGI